MCEGNHRLLSFISVLLDKWAHFIVKYYIFTPRKHAEGWNIKNQQIYLF